MIKIKLFKQSHGFCGPACFKMVMDYYGESHPEMYWAKLTAVKITNGRIDRNEGCSDDMFVAAVKEMGFNGFCKDGSSIDEVRRYVSRKTPVIVNWFSPEQDGHYSVVIGFEGNKIVLADPYIGKLRKMPIESFEGRWFDHMPYPIKSLKQFIWVRRICVVGK